MKLIITAEAESDLIHIGDYIAQDNPRRAMSFVAELEARCEAIVHQPSGYALIPRYEAYGIRRAVHGNYLIFYRVEPGAVVILHVLNSAMDFERILFPTS